MSNWQARLRDSADHQGSDVRVSQDAAEHGATLVEHFYADVVTPAFRELEGLLRQFGRQVSIQSTNGNERPNPATIAVSNDRVVELELSVSVEGDLETPRASAQWTRTDWQDGQRSSFKDSAYEAHSFVKPLSEVTSQQIVERFMEEYMPIFEDSNRSG